MKNGYRTCGEKSVGLFFSECETYFVNQRAEKMSCFGKLFWVYKIEMNGFNSQKM